MITYSFVDPKVQQLIHPGEEALILPSPISSEMSAMRLSLLTGLLGTVVYNQNRQQSRVRILKAVCALFRIPVLRWGFVRT
ncbi:hypothetical protein DMH27_07275 [Raoultella planticola]|nr:hypothetical protein [Raoultella planticola]